MSRHANLIVLLLAAIAPLHASAQEPAAGAGPVKDTVYVTLQGANAVERHPDGARWEAGKAMTYVSVSPDRRRVLATSSGESRVYHYDAATGTLLKRIDVGRAPKGIKISPDGNRVYVSGIAGQVVNVIDPRRGERIAQIEVGLGPHGLRTDATGKRLYVAVSGAGKVAVIDTATDKVIRQIDAGPTPFWIAVAGNR